MITHSTNKSPEPEQQNAYDRESAHFLVRVSNSNLKGEDIKDICKAVALSKDLHADQEDRPDGTPYFLHPLRVANNLIEQLGVVSRDHIIAALLHDLVEDQPEKLASLVTQVKTSEVGSITQKALLAIEHFYGQGVRELVELLTNPESPARQKGVSDKDYYREFREAYAAHVLNLFDHPSGVIAIKLADLYDNVFSIPQIPDQKIRDRMHLKYDPVLRGLSIRLKELDDNQHILASNPLEIARTLDDALQRR